LTSIDNHRQTIAAAVFQVRLGDFKASEVALTAAIEDVVRSVLAGHAPAGAASAEFRASAEKHFVFFTSDRSSLEYDDENLMWQLEADIEHLLGQEMYGRLRGASVAL